MQAVFEQRAKEHRRLGTGPYTRFVLGELGALMMDALLFRFAAPARTERTAPSMQRDLPYEVLEAQTRVNVNLNRLLFAISHRQFREARFYSDEERKAREELRRVREKYGLGNPA
jgi:hypothetical protein